MYCSPKCTNKASKLRHRDDYLAGKRRRYRMRSGSEMPIGHRGLWHMNELFASHGSGQS